MDAFIDWPKDNPPVHIHKSDGVEKILKPHYLPTMLKSPEVEVLGVLVDADFVDVHAPEVSVARRYSQIRGLCKGLFPAFPETLPATGLILDNDDGKRLGVWIMPDNASDGYLETFLRYLVPADLEPIWSHAQSSTTAAKALGAAFHNVHTSKANLRTYLAWQDPPGDSYGIALSKSVLDPKSPHAAAFVSWFRNLYRL